MRSFMMNKKSVNELLNLVEEFINEVSDELVNRVEAGRESNWEKARQDLEKEKTPENQAAYDKALKKLQRFSDLRLKRQNRQQAEAHKLRQFRDKLADSEPVSTRKAELEHYDAMLNQYLRNKLEGLLNKKSETLKESYDNIISVMEDLIDFNKKKKEINNRKQREALAQEMNKMMASGELESIKYLPNGEIMGRPEVVKKMYEMKKKLKELGDIR